MHALVGTVDEKHKVKINKSYFILEDDEDYPKHSKVRVKGC